MHLKNIDKFNRENFKNTADAMRAIYGSEKITSKSKKVLLFLI